MVVIVYDDREVIKKIRNVVEVWGLPCRIYPTNKAALHGLPRLRKPARLAILDEKATPVAEYLKTKTSTPVLFITEHEVRKMVALCDDMGDLNHPKELTQILVKYLVG